MSECSPKATNTKRGRPKNLSDEFCMSCCPYDFFKGLTLGAEVQVCVPTHPLRFWWKPANHPVLSLTEPSAHTDSFGYLAVRGGEKFNLIATVNALAAGVRIQDGAAAITAGANEPIAHTAEMTRCRCDPHPLRNNPLPRRQISAQEADINLLLPLTNH